MVLCYYVSCYYVTMQRHREYKQVQLEINANFNSSKGYSTRSRYTNTIDIEEICHANGKVMRVQLMAMALSASLFVDCYAIISGVS